MQQAFLHHVMQCNLDIKSGFGCCFSSQGSDGAVSDSNAAALPRLKEIYVDLCKLVDQKDAAVGLVPCLCMYLFIKVFRSSILTYIVVVHRTANYFVFQ